MLTNLDLLRLSPNETMLAILQDSLKVGFAAKYLTFSAPVAGVGTETKVTVTVDKGKTPVEYWTAEDSFLFTYSRLDLSNEIGDLGLKVVTALPTTRHLLIRKLFAKSDIYFDTAEFIDGPVEIGDTSFAIEPVDSSVRWVGSTSIIVERRVDELSSAATVLDLYSAMAYNTDTVKQTGPAEIRLLNQFIIDNNLDIQLPINLDDFVFSNLTRLNAREDVVNTAITLTMVNQSRYKGSVVLRYRRLSLNKITNNLAVPVYDIGAMSTSGLGAQAADKIGIYLPFWDIVDDPLEYIGPGQHTTVTVSVNEDSMMYVGRLVVEWFNDTPR
jgi:hypothetical protein